MRGKHVAFVAVLAGVALGAVGCGGGGGNESTTETTTTEATATETTTTEATGATKLIGTVGSEGNPDDFVISLKTEDGSDVTSLSPGDYTLEINDMSTIHNFHLTGPGGVDVSSEVGETEDENYDITLQDGTYDFVCDPHSSQMKGSFQVSG